MHRQVQPAGGPIARRARFAALLVALLLGTDVRAAVFNIADGDVPGLIAAINTANANGDADTINLAANGAYTLTAVDNLTDGPNGLPSIDSELTINGRGAVISRGGKDGTSELRILHLSAGADVTLYQTTLSRGLLTSDSGAGLYSRAGAAVLNACAISDNTANHGGGVFNDGGRLTIVDTLFADNAATRAGGIYNNAGRILLSACTITRNRAEIYLAVYNRSDIKMTNCSVSGNSEVPDDHSICIGNEGGMLFLTHCTLAGNQHPALDSFNGGVITLSNTIVANAVGGDCAGDVIDDGYNIIRDGSCVTHPTSMSGAPGISSLGYHGGSTQTHALLPGSIAMNAGDCDEATVRVDQRGVTRPRGPACDIGAFEFLPGDLDGDSDVDLTDFALFAQCFSGANLPPAGGCTPGVHADLDGDSDVDLTDFKLLSHNFNGAK